MSVTAGQRFYPRKAALQRLSLLAAFLVFGWCAASRIQAAAGPSIYHTGFEVSEGYSTNNDLAGQNGWIAYGSGGNGIVDKFFSLPGQQAYIGYTAPNAGDQNLFLSQPINKTLSRAQFSVMMAVADSSARNTNYDDFYWAVYNQRGDQLFGVDFDNYELAIYYWLDNTNSRVAAHLAFTNGVPYRLTIDLDFLSNRWSATFNGALLATNQPITTVGAPLNLGDVDAGWGIYNVSLPGDNYMVFDDYTLTGQVPAPQVLLLGTSAAGAALRLYGQAATTFAIDASTNLLNWTPLKTNITTGGSFDYIDDRAAAFRARFYRGRWVP